MPWALGLLRVQPLLVDHGLGRRVDKREVRVRAGFEGTLARVQAVQPGGTLREHPRQSLRADQPVQQRINHDRADRFDTLNSSRGRGQAERLFRQRVRCVVRTDRLDRAIPQRLPQRAPIARGANRRVDLQHHPELGKISVAERQVVRAGLGSEPHAFGLGAPNGLCAARRRRVDHMEATVGGGAQFGGDGNRHCFGCIGTCLQ